MAQKELKRGEGTPRHFQCEAWEVCAWLKKN